MICKKRVGELFLKSFKDQYASEAKVQKQTAKRLVEELSKIQSQFERVLELGCGSGILTNEIFSKLEIEKLFLNDLSDICELIDVDAEFIIGDAETVNYPDKLDLITSNAVIQWFENLSQHFTKVAESLTEGGIVAFTTFGPKNMIELRKTLNVGLDYHSKEEITELLSERFEILLEEEFEYKSLFPSAKDVLKHVQKTGVNGVSESGLTKSKLKQFIADYQQFTTDNGVELTYNPILIIAKKTT